jgi:hypothetical protein
MVVIAIGRLTERITVVSGRVRSIPGRRNRGSSSPRTTGVCTGELPSTLDVMGCRKAD